MVIYHHRCVERIPLQTVEVDRDRTSALFLVKDDAASSVMKLSWSCVRSLMSLESTTGTGVMGHEKLTSLCVNWGGRF